MSILDKIKKNSTIKDTAILSASKFFTKKDMIPTSIPVINVALSGRLDGDAKLFQGVEVGLHGAGAETAAAGVVHLESAEMMDQGADQHDLAPCPGLGII